MVAAGDAHRVETPGVVLMKPPREVGAKRFGSAVSTPNAGGPGHHVSNKASANCL